MRENKGQNKMVSPRDLGRETSANRPVGKHTDNPREMEIREVGIIHKVPNPKGFVKGSFGPENE